MGSNIAHRVSIDQVDCGSVLASLEPGVAGELATEAVVSLANQSCSLAISSMSRRIDRVDYLQVKSSIWHLRPAVGVVSAAALVDSVLADRLADDIRRNGTMNARVNVAMVDAAGDTVALGTIDYCVRTA
jgi:hypothetical protein